VRLEDVEPEMITPPHDITSEEKAEKLEKSMLKHGWNGLPLLVYEYNGRYNALTGSHRLFAATRVLNDVPALIIEKRDLNRRQWGMVYEIGNQDDMVRTLAKLVEEGADIAEALELASREEG